MKVAIDLAALSAPSLVRRVHFRRLDLTRLCVWSRSCRSRRHRRPLLEFTSTASASPRPLQLVHARHLDPDPFLITSATDLVTADRQSTLGEHHHPAKTLTCRNPPSRACDAVKMTMMLHRPPDLGSLPFRPARPRQATGSGLAQHGAAQICRFEPKSCFSEKSLFCLENPARLKMA
jgi:hypothetical protein